MWPSTNRNFQHINMKCILDSVKGKDQLNATTTWDNCYASSIKDTQFSLPAPLYNNSVIIHPPFPPKQNNLYFFIYLLRIALVDVDHCKWHSNSKEKQSVHIGFVHQQCASLGCCILGKRIPCILSTNIPSFSFNWIQVVTYGDKIQTCMIAPAICCCNRKSSCHHVCLFSDQSRWSVGGTQHAP
jgi:hypothetical protein